MGGDGQTVTAYSSSPIYKNGILEMANIQFLYIEKLYFDDMAGRLWAGEAALFAI